MKAGFSEIEITPPVGTCKIGWLMLIRGERVNDPLYARVAIFESAGARVAFVQLDTLSARAVLVAEIRARIAQDHGFPGEAIMVAATHNHAGPAVTDAGEVPRDVAYCETLVEKVSQAFGAALRGMQAAEIGFGRALNFELAANRRVVMRDGLTKTHGSFKNPEALYIEGPVDPEVVVLAARGRDGKLLGALVNYSCHPTHFGGEPVFSAGWPGVMADLLKAQGCPVPMFLNGAEGQTHHACPVRGDRDMAFCGKSLAASAQEALGGIVWRQEAKLGVAKRELVLPYREATEDQVRGTAHGAQRFIDPKIYDRIIPRLLEEMKGKRGVEAEIQVVFVDEFAFVSLPGEFFVEFGLAIKEQVFPRRAVPVGLANGIVGYVPTRDAFKRGGYETTFMTSSKLAPEAGEVVVAAAVGMIRGRVS